MKKLLCALALIAAPAFASADNFSNREIECLARNVYFEARGEPDRGQEYVAWVTLNRADHSAYPDGICEVVYQPRQFSWTAKNPSIKNQTAWQRSLDVAKNVITKKVNGVSDPTDGSTMFHAAHASPSWRRSFSRVASIGNHVFYK